MSRLVRDVVRECVELVQGRRLGLREQVSDSGGRGDVAEVFQRGCAQEVSDHLQL